MMQYAYGWAGGRVWRGPLDLSIMRALRREERPRIAREAPPVKMLSDRDREGARDQADESGAAEASDRGGSAMMRLPLEERQVLMQRLFEGLSCATIAAQSGRSEADVRRMQLSALEHMRGMIPNPDVSNREE